MHFDSGAIRAPPCDKVAIQAELMSRFDMPWLDLCTFTTGHETINIIYIEQATIYEALDPVYPCWKLGILIRVFHDTWNCQDFR